MLKLFVGVVIGAALCCYFPQIGIWAATALAKLKAKVWG